MKLKNTIVIVVLSVIVGVAGTVGFFQLKGWKDNVLQNATNQGAQQGFELAISGLYQRLENCAVITIGVDEQRKDVIDVACLKLQPQPEEPTN